MISLIFIPTVKFSISTLVQYPLSLYPGNMYKKLNSYFGGHISHIVLHWRHLGKHIGYTVDTQA